MLEVFPERIKKYVETLKRNAERLNTLTSDILDVTKNGGRYTKAE